MPTSYSDQFFVIDPGVPPAAGTALTKTFLNYVDQNNNGFISPSGNDSVNGLDITRVWVGDTIRVVMNGVTQTITGVTFYVTGGPAVFTPTDGTVLSNATFVSSTSVTQSTQIPVGAFGPPCFTAGTLIAVPGGEVAVESLRPGDLVLTADHAAQTVRWIGRRRVIGQRDFAPVRFAPGALGNPAALLVSPLHRMVVAGWDAELHFGAPEVLVEARHLVGRPGVTRAPCRSVDYVHILFDRHEIVTAGGVPSESFHPDSILMERDSILRAEIVAIFPELACPRRRARIGAARPVVSGRMAAVLAA